MKNIMPIITRILDAIYGLGIIICLYVGGVTFVGFLIAFIIGGNLATSICIFIYDQVFGVLIYGGNVIVLLGLLNMYLKKQKFLTISDTTSEMD